MTQQPLFKHTVPVQVRFNDIDPLGHVNNSVYFTFYDLGKVNYFAALRPQMTQLQEIDLVIANVNANFLLPIFVHDEIAVQTTTLSIGNKSVKLLQQIADVKTGAVKANCETVLVGFDFKSGTTKVISQEWREAIEAYEGRVF